MVLKSPDIPSMLVETAYISNPQEVLRLRTPAHQARLAAAIRQGVHDYFYANLPMGTRIGAAGERRFGAARVGDGLLPADRANSGARGASLNSSRLCENARPEVAIAHPAVI